VPVGNACYRHDVIVLRCTAKLLARLGDVPAVASAMSSSRLGDWYATLVRVRRGQFVLAISRETLLPVVVTARDLRSFPQRMSERLVEMLEAYGVPAEAIDSERDAMREIAFARTDDRSTVGVLVDLQRLLVYGLNDHPSISLLEQSLHLAQTPIVARKTFPCDATCKRFGIEPPARWWKTEVPTTN